MADTEYADAWKEGETDSPAENAVAAAAKKAALSDKDEYITAYADLENGASMKADAKKAKADKDEDDEKKDAQ